jgi:hypothetical protein
MNDFNYFCGFRITYRRAKWYRNTDPLSETITPWILNGIFDYTKPFDEDTEPLQVPGTDIVYTW